MSETAEDEKEPLPGVEISDLRAFALSLAKSLQNPEDEDYAVLRKEDHAARARELRTDLCRLTIPEWGAIVDAMVQPDEIDSEQDDCYQKIMRAVDSKMHHVFTSAAGSTQFKASNLLIDLIRLAH